MADPMRGGSSPLWRLAHATQLGTPLRGPVLADVAVVGAGITGLTLALLLQRQGLSVALLEAERVGAGDSGATSAHVTSVPDVSYRELLARHGRVRASALAGGCGRAMEFIRTLARSSVPCSLESCLAYRYAESASEVDELRRELEATRELGILASLADSAPLPFPVAGALVFARQAVFNPAQYLAGLARLFLAEGGRLHEHARVATFEEESDSVVLQAAGGLVVATHAVLATHTPLGRNPVHAETVPKRSYLLALKTRDELAEGLFWDSETPYHYLRRLRWEDQSLVLVGGEDHPVGHGDPLERYDRLERFARARFRDVEVVRRWSGQLYEPADGLPYAGRSPLTERVFVATGYAGAGLVLGTMAAHVVADLILGRPDSPLSELVRATRVPGLAAAASASRQALEAAAHFSSDPLDAGRVSSVAEIVEGSGAIVEVDGEKLAVYRDGTGGLHALSPVCSHMGCIVRWNAAERSWDCPCHGGRFSALGHVQSGPPLEDLETRTRGLATRGGAR